MRAKHWHLTTALTGLSAALMVGPAYAKEIQPSDLLNLSLEQLSNIEVTSVSKRSEKASEAAAAIYVITQDDIRQSGMTNIPELLRMVPGLTVAQSGSHQWAITARGFNGQFANKLLVLIDGRSVYTPLYSGVYWDVQDTPLQDIERIEVIRGPGATLWGANAVNGVINIITKNAKDTQGGMASASMGSLLNGQGMVRYGAKMGDGGHTRAYAKYDDYDEVNTTNGRGAGDPWNKAQAGFRSDWKQNASTFTLQGDMYRAGESGVLNLPASMAPLAGREHDSGANLLGRWTNKLSDVSELSMQMYYDYTRRSNIVFTNNLQTFDFDVQHAYSPTSRQEIVWGVGYRLVKNEATNTEYVQFTPMDRSDNLFSAFVQDKFTLVANQVFLTLGSKFEHNDYTGFEFQPSARLSWLIDDSQMVWTSVSRALRTPNIGATDSRVLAAAISASPLTFLAQTSSQDLKSEELISYELGYRIQPAKNISLDVAGYYNDYERLTLGSLGAASGPYASTLFGPYFIQAIDPISMGTAHSWGFELTAKWNPTNWMELSSGYTFEKLKLDQLDPYGYSYNGKTPEQQFNIRSVVQLPHDVEWTTALYYTDELRAIDLNTGNGIPEYTRLDMRLAWKATTNLELSLVGQNLLDGSHQEFSSFLYQNSSEIPRTVYGNITLKF